VTAGSVAAPAPRVDQVLPTFGYGDAIGNHVLALRALLRRAGFVSEVFAQAVHERLRAEARDWREYAAVDAPGNVCLFHFSIGTPLATAFTRLRARRVLIYHNVTPARFAHGVNRRMERECRMGREQLRALAAGTELAIGVSEYNRRELEELGFADTAVLPVIVDFADHDRQPPAPELVRRWRDGRTNVLHVGRFAPNKRIEDLVRAFHVYRRVNPASRLLLVGTDAGLENYAAAVRDLAARLGTPDVHFVGHVDFRELCTCYRVADLYLTMSEHEGFCVPLLEAMHFGVPIVAHAAAAVPETLGGAGLLFGEKRFEDVAELMDLAVSDPALRAGLIAAGRRRLDDFAPARIGSRLLELLASRGVRLSGPG
jgi:glycosyltransferase involved in cell wall biosynthesis